MAIKSFNALTIAGAVGFFVLLTTLFNLHSRAVLQETREEVQTNRDSELSALPKLPPPSSLELENIGGPPPPPPPPHFDSNPAPAVTVTATVTVTARGSGVALPAPTESRPSFLEIATKWGTDKVNIHHYNYMYAKYLEPIRDQRLKVLEIGLGCDMIFGPGKSYYTWKEYLPNVDLYYIEYDKECVDRWSVNMHDVKVFAGSQEDEAFLDSFIAASGGNFDVIIDDGGHTMNQQIVSLNKLFPIVKPGGYYFCEDLGTSYQPIYGAIAGAKTMMMVIEELINDLNWKVFAGPVAKNAVGKDMRFVDCGEEICAFTKKELDGI